jgi:hypothetical protein
VRGEHGTSPGCTADAGADGRALPASGDRADRGADARADANLLGVFAFACFGLAEKLGGGQPHASSVGKRQRIQRDGYRRDLFHFAARIGFNDDALDVGALFRDYPIIVDDRLGERGRESLSRLIGFRRE